jgi:hypothetical protein
MMPGTASLRHCSAASSLRSTSSSASVASPITRSAQAYSCGGVRRPSVSAAWERSSREEGRGVAGSAWCACNWAGRPHRGRGAHC